MDGCSAQKENVPPNQQSSAIYKSEAGIVPQINWEALDQNKEDTKQLKPRATLNPESDNEEIKTDKSCLVFKENRLQNGQIENEFQKADLT